MYFQRQSFLSSMPPVVKVIFITNVALFLLSQVVPFINNNFPIYSFESENFRPYQFITHLFMHGGIGHIFFNMFALIMFGTVLERYWGSKRFFVYYFVTGIGAALLHLLVVNYQIHNLMEQMTANDIQYIHENGYKLWQSGRNFPGIYGDLNLYLIVKTVGASGAVYGLLLAFAIFFPNIPLYIMFIPIPVKAKYVVIFMAIIELSLGFAHMASDNIAHFAHLGGMLFGLIFIFLWRKMNKDNISY